jgi:enoyl-CoA hydratase/carnithine racemase
MSSLPDTDYRNVLVTRDDSAARIVLNRPEKRNALSLELLEELIAALREVSGWRDSRAIVIEGAGPAFSAGHDLSEMIGRDRDFLAQLFDRCSVMMQTVHEVPQPVIAKVHGIAAAAGCQLVAACDLAVAAEGTRFATPGVKIGLFCSTPMVPVSRAIGRKRAMQMLLTGEPIDAATAQAHGLVNRLVDDGGACDAAVELATAIAANGPLAVAASKQIATSADDWSHDERWTRQHEINAAVFTSRDAREGATAFAEKRPPRFTGS